MLRTAYETYRREAGWFAGPAVVETFGVDGFCPVNCPQAYKLGEKQEELTIAYANESMQVLNDYIPGDETSFTIIAFPVPAIGADFEQIFAETIRINTLDYEVYKEIQQHIIDVLDQAKQVMADMDLSRVLHIVEKKLLEEDYTSLDLASALLRMSMGEENQDIAIDSQPARSLDDLDSWGRVGRGRGRDNGRGRSGRDNRGGRGRKSDGDMARLFVNLGKNQGVRPGDILGAVAGESGISGRMIGSIDMYDKYTSVEVPSDCAGEVVECMKNAKIRGKNVHVELANSQQ